MIIPVALFFDKNYLIPASVTITSLLMNADSDHEYHIHVFYNDISNEDIQILSTCCSDFPNAKFFSRNMEGQFSDLFSQTISKAHFSKEMYYKFLVPSLLSNYDRAIISDVDVVFLGDVSSTFLKSLKTPGPLVFGCKVPSPEGSFAAKNKDQYRKDFSQQEIEKFIVGGGYYVFDLAQMRREGIEQQFIDTARENAHRLRQPEQDVISLVCYPRIEVLPLASMICSYCYDLFTNEVSYDNVVEYTALEVRSALQKPVQLHFATQFKPWNTLDCTKSDIWHQYLFLTPFSKRYLGELAEKCGHDVLWSAKLPFSRKNALRLSNDAANRLSYS